MMKIKIPPIILKHLAKLKPLAKHHYFIVSIILLSAVGFAIFVVNQTLNAPTDAAYQQQQLQSTIGSKFNQSAKDTINKIKALQKSTDPATGQQPLPAGRINPFAE